jgi:hypothetical protein
VNIVCQHSFGEVVTREIYEFNPVAFNDFYLLFFQVFDGASVEFGE